MEKSIFLFCDFPSKYNLYIIWKYLVFIFTIQKNFQCCNYEE